MRKKTNYKKKIIKIFHDLEETHPNYTMGMHIATAFGDYKIEDLWSMPEREFLFTLEKYQTQLELDGSNIADDEYVRLIQKDATENLFGNKEEEEDGI